MSPESRARLINKGTRLDLWVREPTLLLRRKRNAEHNFIGGPRDGELMAVQDSVVARGAIDVPTISTPSVGDPVDLIDPVPFKTHTHRVHKFIDTDGESVLWLAVSEDIDSDHIMEHILQEYSDARA